MTRIWRIYPNGRVKDETHVLWPHFADGMKCSGYDGDVQAWSEHNKFWRAGCAQLVSENGEPPKVLYQGNVSIDVTNAFIIERGFRVKQPKMTDEEVKKVFACVDCSVCTHEIDEYYMVHDHLWEKAGMTFGMLCIGCLETRLGRRLNSRDFPRYPVNHGSMFQRSERLKSRLGATSALICQ